MRMEVKRTSVMKKAMILKDAEAFKVYRQVYEFLTNELGMENISVSYTHLTLPTKRIV